MSVGTPTTPLGTPGLALPVGVRDRTEISEANDIRFSPSALPLQNSVSINTRSVILAPDPYSLLRCAVSPLPYSRSSLTDFQSDLTVHQVALNMQESRSGPGHTCWVMQ